jgi:hypothetical protein
MILEAAQFRWGPGAASQRGRGHHKVRQSKDASLGLSPSSSKASTAIMGAPPSGPHLTLTTSPKPTSKSIYKQMWWSGFQCVACVWHIQTTVEC